MKWPIPFHLYRLLSPRVYEGIYKFSTNQPHLVFSAAWSRALLIVHCPLVPERALNGGHMSHTHSKYVT